MSTEDTQVQELADDLRDNEATEGTESFENSARFLIAQGWTKP